MEQNQLALKSQFSSTFSSQSRHTFSNQGILADNLEKAEAHFAQHISHNNEGQKVTRSSPSTSDLHLIKANFRRIFNNGANSKATQQSMALQNSLYSLDSATIKSNVL